MLDATKLVALHSERGSPLCPFPSSALLDWRKYTGRYLDTGGRNGAPAYKLAILEFLKNCLCFKIGGGIFAIHLTYNGFRKQGAVICRKIIIINTQMESVYNVSCGL